MDGGGADINDSDDECLMTFEIIIINMKNIFYIFIINKCNVVVICCCYFFVKFLMAL